MEHVVAAITLRSNYRGAIAIKLKSPKGTSSNLLRTRPLDFDSILGFTEWPFMTVHNWGEDPEGTWTLTVKTAESIWEVVDYYSGYTNSNKISRWTLTLYGTKEPPLSSSRCHAQCNGCIGPGSDHCLSCLNFNEERQGTTYCVEKCSSGKIPSFTLNGRDISCVSNCKTGTFRDGDRCVPCHWGCETYSKSPLGSVNCTACRNGYLRHAETCVDACPGGYYEDRELNICSSCSGVTKHCGTCSASSCLSCNFPYYLEDGYCQNCPVGTYRPRYTDYFNDTSWCKDCNFTCKTCYGEYDYHCLSCWSGVLFDHKCLKSCPDGTYTTTDGKDTVKRCRSCSLHCRSCTGPSTASCTSCESGYFFHNQSCINACPSGTYLKCGSDGDRCFICKSPCKTCNGPENTDCTSCLYGLILQLNSCVLPCPDGRYRARNGTSTSRCEKCHRSCRTCYGPGENHCLSCENDNNILYNHQCMETCPNGTYQHEQFDGKSCRQCYRFCQTCTGRHEDDCESCTNSMVLHGGQCLSSCPVGTYSVSDQSGPLCAACDSNCKSCNATSCLSCNYPYILQNGYCTCPEGTYGESDVLSCISCHSSCKTCSGPSDRQCLGCYYLDILYERRCVDTCPDGTYTNSNDGTTRKSCDDCHSSCKTCTGPSDIECVSCGKGTYLRGSECIDCDDGCEERDGKGGSNGGNTVPIVCGSLSALVIVIFAAAVIVRKCSGRGRRLGNRPWRSLVTVADDNSANTLLTTTGEESNTEQLY